jgi:hypothetical protein
MAYQRMLCSSGRGRHAWQNHSFLFVAQKPHRLARREKRSIADIVERALEAYEVREAGREPAASFYARLSVNYGTDVDLEAVIRKARRVNTGPDL